MQAVLTDRHNPCSVQHRSPRNRRQEKSKKHAHDPERAGDRSGQGLGRAAFLVRVAALLGTMSPEQLASFWVGAVVADDAGHLARHPILARSPPIWTGGREPLRSLYAGWLAGLLEGPVTPLDEELSEAASALGALAVVLFRSTRGVRAIGQPLLNRLHDQTTWPRITAEPGSSRSTGTRGYSRPC